jgi:hypothetical protein
MPKIVRDKLAKKYDDAASNKEDHLAFGGAANLHSSIADVNLYGSDSVFDIKPVITTSDYERFAPEEIASGGNCLFQPDFKAKIILHAGVSCTIKFGNGQLTLQAPTDGTLEVPLSALDFFLDNVIN